MAAELPRGSVRRRTLVILSCATALLILAIGIPIALALLGNYRELESRTLDTNRERFRAAYADVLAKLDDSLVDYSTWDDMCDYIARPTERFVESNLQPQTFQDLGWSLFVIFDTNGAVVFSRGHDATRFRTTSVPDAILALGQQRDRLVTHTTPDDQVAGVLNLPPGPCLVASRPIVSSRREGPLRGTVLVGRPLDESFVTRLSQRIRIPFTLTPWANWQSDASLAAALALTPTEGSARVARFEKDHADLLELLPDVHGQPGLVASLRFSRDLYARGVESVITMVLLLGGAGLLFTLAAMWMLDRGVLRRLQELSAQTAALGVTGDLSTRLPTGDRDEIDHLAGAVNGMLESLQKKQAALQAAQQELLKAQKLDSVALLAGGIAHDYNNILTALMGSLSLARLSYPPHAEGGLHLDVAENAAIRARDLTHQLLTFARFGEPTRTAVSPAHLIEETARFALTGSNVSLECDISPDLQPVYVNAGQLSQVITNLVINARQAMPDGGVVRIACQNFPATSRDQGGGRVRIRVQDNGPGISEEVCARIFDAYFTTKADGNGLGLAICRRIVEKSGGTLTVHSKPGEGTTFMIMLPAVATSESSTILPREQLAPGQGRILVMDDEQDILELLGVLLHSLGYRLATAAEGDSAIRLYAEALERAERFDAVILDLTIAGGLGGEETARRILAMDPDACLIVSSGYTDHPAMKDYERAGFCARLAKPYTVAELSELLQTVLSAPDRETILRT